MALKADLPWLDARTYYRRRWSQDVGRVGVDGGFSCPHRSADRQQGGCTFCSGAGNRPPYLAGAQGLDEQIARGLAFGRDRYGYQAFSLYFQAYTSTAAPLATLEALYRGGLAQGPFVELVVGTRPDCVDDEVLDLLAEFQGPDREVWVELGLQSASNATLARVNRGHDVEAYRDAARRVSARGLGLTTHLMYGLPGEGREAFLASVAEAVAAGSRGLKFHDLLLAPGTELHRQWQRGEIEPVDPEAYLDAAASALVSLPADVVVWRVASDPEDRKTEAAPGGKWSKNRFLQALAAEVRKRRGL